MSELCWLMRAAACEDNFLFLHHGPHHVVCGLIWETCENIFTSCKYFYEIIKQIANHINIHHKIISKWWHFKDPQNQSLFVNVNDFGTKHPDFEAQVSHTSCHRTVLHSLIHCLLPFAQFIFGIIIYANSRRWFALQRRKSVSSAKVKLPW